MAPSVHHSGEYDGKKKEVATTDEIGPFPQESSEEGPGEGPVAEALGYTEIDMGFGVLLISTGLVAAGAGLLRLKVPFQHRDLFERIGKAEGVDADLLHAIAWQESNIDPEARSPMNKNGTRDWGMMQINEINFGLLGLNQLTALRAEDNVKAAAGLLNRIAANSKVTNTNDILSIYNAGDANRRPFGTGPRLTRAGGYVSSRYVADASGKLSLVRVAKVVPLARAAPAPAS